MTKVRTNLGKVATTPKGEYNSATTYVKLDIVTYNGSSYVCLQESVGNLPTNTTYWQLMASKGETGASGQDGQDGHTPVKGVDYFTQEDIASLNIPSATSDITNDSGFITKSVNDLVNYYLKSETYTKEEVNTIIGNIQQFHYEVVQQLPATGESNIMYLVPKSTSQTNNYYDEYVYSNGWEKIGDTEIDLSNYITDTDYATNNKGGVVKINGAYGVSINSSGEIYGRNYDYSQYNNINSNNFVSKGTLENVITGKGLVDNTGLATKQDVIDSSHKLDADLVDDTNSTNKFFSGDYEDLSNKPSFPDIQYIGQDSDTPFVFSGKKKGIYYFNSFNSFAYKITNNSDTQRLFTTFIPMIIMSEDYEYESGKKIPCIIFAIKTANNGDGQQNDIYTNPSVTNDMALSTNRKTAGYYLTTTNQTITGSKTFSNIPRQNNTTAPTDDREFTNKKYVDDQISGAIGSINTILATLTTPSNNGGN